MADLALANSTYSTGTNDTSSTLINNVSAVDAQQWNGVATAAVGIENVLGTATDLKGNKLDLVARLAIGTDADGKLNLSTDAAINGPLSVAKGGTGIATVTANRVLIGDGTNDLIPGTGLIFHGPTSVGTGSTQSHEGTFSSATGNLSGIHYYTDFTLNNGHTLTVPAGKRRLIIIATGTITINGTITAAGAGGPSAGAEGTDQPGGGGGFDGGGAAVPGNNGGGVVRNGIVFAAGGLGSGGGTGGAATQVTGSDILANWLDAMGGAAGGSAANGSGSPGGGSIVLIAPTVILGSTAVLNTSGTAGSGGSGAGGGGGAGNVYVACRSYTDNGATFTLTGGASGGTNFAGGAGANGIKQILIYA